MRRCSRSAATTAALLGFAILAAACVRDPDPFTVDSDDVSVHLVLVAGSDSVLAIVEKPLDPVEDAEVLLIRGADTTQLAFAQPLCSDDFLPGPTTGGCYRALLAAPVEAGATYELEITLPDGHRITGQTTVPLPLDVTSPADGARLTADCNPDNTCYAEGLDVPPYFVPVVEVTVRWEASVETERLIGFVRPLRTFLDGTVYTGEEGCRLGYFGAVFGGFAGRVTPDSMAVVIPNIDCPGNLSPARFDSIHAEVVVQYQNREAAEYLALMREFGTGLRAAHLSLGIEGAWGLFGAMTPNAVAVTIVRDPPPGEDVP